MTRPQANSEALQWAASAGCLPQLLGVQLLRLRWAADQLGAKLAAQQERGADGGQDLLGLLQARQALRGRGRHAQMVAL
jgi:hypothetical protein